MSFKNIYVLFVALVLSTGAMAQNAPLLTLKDAIDTALKHNYNIKLAQNNLAISQNNVTLGNAGFLPIATGTASSNNSNQNINQVRADGTHNDLHDVKNTNVSYGANLNWTVFNGFAMFANYDQLKKLNAYSQLLQQDTILSTIAQVLSTYYNIINQQQGLQAFRGAIAISQTQLRYANDKFQVGRASRLDVLNAQVNLNTDTANYITQLQLYKTAKIQLNKLLVRDLMTDFTVADTIVVDNQMKLGDIIAKAEQQNPNVLLSQINKQLADINLRQVQASRYPQVALNSNYAVSNSKSPAGFTRSQDAQGFGYGFTASINIFNGFNQWRNERNAKLQIDNAAIVQKQVLLNVEAQISYVFVSYLSGLDLIKLGQQNVAVAKRNLDISLDKYKLGNITPLEIREAERNYLDAQSKFYAAQYQSKIAEIMLKQITNTINLQ